MNVQVKSSNGITLIPLETRLLADRKVFIEGEINHEKACEFVKEILLLCREDSSKPIDVLINSPGGEINSGLLMYDCIQSCKTPICIWNTLTVLGGRSSHDEIFRQGTAY